MAGSESIRLDGHTRIYEDIQRIVETRLFNGENGGGFRRDDGTINFFSLGLPLFYEGRQFTQPTGGEWMVLSILESASLMKGFDRKIRKTSGTIRIKIVIPHGSGTRRIRFFADKVSARLSFTAGSSGVDLNRTIADIQDNTKTTVIENRGTLNIQPGVLKRISDDDDGYLNYVMEFIFDYYTS